MESLAAKRRTTLCGDFAFWAFPLDEAECITLSDCLTELSAVLAGFHVGVRKMRKPLARSSNLGKSNSDCPPTNLSAKRSHSTASLGMHYGLWRGSLGSPMRCEVSMLTQGGGEPRKRIFASLGMETGWEFNRILLNTCLFYLKEIFKIVETCFFFLFFFLQRLLWHNFVSKRKLGIWKDIIIWEKEGPKRPGHLIWSRRRGSPIFFCSFWELVTLVGRI